MRVIIADPSLSSLSGHHFSLTKRISEAFECREFDVEWATHQSFAKTQYEHQNLVHTVFSHTMYDRYDRGKKHIAYDQIASALFDDICCMVRQLNLTCRDILFFHTGFGDLFEALLMLERSYCSDDWPIIHVCTPYDINTMPGKDSNKNYFDIIAALSSSKMLNRRFYFWTETSLLAEDYNSKLREFTFCPLELPPPELKPMSSIECDNKRFVISYLGAAREEKGFTFLNKIVESIWKSRIKDNVFFFIQATPQIVGYNDNILKTIDSLKSYPSEFLNLEQSTLSEGEYSARLIKSNLLLLLYSKDTYRIRGSGIAIEALCSEIPIITFSDTFCAHVIRDGGGIILDSCDHIVEGVFSAYQRSTELKRETRIAARRYLASNNSETYRSKILAAPLARSQYYQILSA